MASSTLQRLVRFVPRSSPSKILIGQPADKDIDVGAALRQGQEVAVSVWSGSSVLSPGSSTGTTETIDRILSPLAQNEIGTVRCVGLNYRKHAAECGLDPPAIPVIFMKPATTIVDPWPARGTIPKLSQVDESGDYEAELAVVIGKTAKNVSEAEALDYVLGYTAANDVSSRTQQLNQSQWSFSKSFDGACPLGPTLVLKSLITDPTKLHMRGLKNGEVYQESGIDDLIFSIPKIISWLSQGTTLPPGTVIVTGTPAGVGMGRTPKDALRHGDEFAVEILPHIGTLTNIFENEKIPKPKPNEVLIRVATAGFCHTDLMVYHGITQVSLPFIGSHEPAGTIVALGSDVPGIWHIGDRVGVTNFMDPCQGCNGCKWAMQSLGSLDPRFCDNKTMCGIVRRDGAFAEYMVSWHGAVVSLPDSTGFEQAAPLICAGSQATVWHAINQADATKGETIGIIGIGGLGILGIQFAKARGYRVIAIDSHEVGPKLASGVPSHLQPDLVLKLDDPETIQKISDFTDGIGLKATIVCTSDDAASDWAAQRLQPRGILVAAGFPEHGLKFDPMNLILREIFVKGTVHGSMSETREMMEFVVKHGIRSHLTLLTMEEAEDIAAKSEAHAFIGRPVVKIGMH
ncbi:alcohol dehydrogenase V [Fusarium globosum]|uniref:Alcohol dehydrogenase V n=1 Tax=Fusarium globosum TaxID=78864 RepID=A0A8H5Y7M6_9HYPO|nr:alcohol dehydrogenase V [Fusarium globosum]